MNECGLTQKHATDKKRVHWGGLIMFKENEWGLNHKADNEGRLKLSKKKKTHKEENWENQGWMRSCDGM